ncbi:universal stress protein [Chelativorans sp. ZYF759]|uniref:universal stress protein n=1 Tax=Chelativorans sp. ZYF759 TaxID=2692213 RepID=UPI00145D6A47|nr:universal stress protein [Chelativorans sp. ZYF759]
MSIKTVMVQLDVDEPAEKRLRSGLDLAGRFEAGLIAFCAADYRVHLPYEGGRAVAEAQRGRRDEIAARLKLLHREFVDLAGEGAGVVWMGRIGHPTELLALHAAAADLLVVGTPRMGEVLQRDRRVDLGRLVVAAGRPVLVLGADEDAPAARTIVVAWKNAREARRAVVDALPLMAAADRVIVATVPEGDETRARESCAEAVRHLAAHGIKAEEALLQASSAPPAVAIANLARDVGADLVVSGAYGHSRLREWAFGGVTRSLLTDGSLSRFLSN